MPQYGSVAAGVVPRLGGRPLDAVAHPTIEEVELWMDEAEAEMLGVLAANGISAPAPPPATQGGLILSHHVNAYITRMVRAAQAAAGGDSTNPDGERARADWEAWLDRIRQDPEQMSGELAIGSSEVSSVRLSSYVTDNTDGKTSADFAPRVTTGEQW